MSFYRICILSVLYFSLLPDIKGQAISVLNSKIITVSLDKFPDKKSEKRKLLVFSKKKSHFHPLYFAGGTLLFFYQNILSEQIQANCTYETSCSEYTKLCIQTLGFFTGVLAGFNQWTECYKGAIYEHPPAYRNSNNKIKNYFEKAVD